MLVVRAKRSNDEPEPFNVRDVVNREIGSANRRKPSWRSAINDLIIRIWRQRYCKEDDEIFSHRTIGFEVLLDSEPIAVGHFVEWRSSSICFLDEFVFAADAVSQADYDMAELLKSKWTDGFSPFDYGNIVRFERLVIKSSNRSPLVWKLISEMIEREFEQRCSLLMLKAFPLEFEGRHDQHSPPRTRERFQSRLAAMKRYYERVLRAVPVPGYSGKQGWMYRGMRYRSKL
jgi:hypothetical protein